VDGVVEVGAERLGEDVPSAFRGFGVAGVEDLAPDRADRNAAVSVVLPVSDHGEVIRRDGILRPRNGPRDDGVSASPPDALGLSRSEDDGRRIVARAVGPKREVDIEEGGVRAVVETRRRGKVQPQRPPGGGRKRTDGKAGGLPPGRRERILPEKLDSRKPFERSVEAALQHLLGKDPRRPLSIRGLQWKDSVGGFLPIGGGGDLEQAAPGADNGLDGCSEALVRRARG
jgi:hypothetical protein